MWSLVSGDKARGIYSHMFVVLSEEYYSRYYPTHLFSAIVIPRALLIMGVYISLFYRGIMPVNIFMETYETQKQQVPGMMNKTKM